MFVIKDCADVFVDACVRNEAGQLVFMSLYGRDTATRELMARIQLPSGQESLRELRLAGFGAHQGELHTVYISDAKELDKVAGRLPKSLYGELTQVWIFHPSISAPDKGAKRAWIIEPGTQLDRTELRQRVWRMVCELADIPLLPHWCDAVLDAIWDSMVFELGQHNPDDSAVAAQYCRPIGPIWACQVRLGEDFPNRISQLMRAGQIHIDPEVPALTPALLTRSA